MNQDSLDHHLKPTSAAEFLQGLKQTKGELVISKNQYSPDPRKVNRYLTYLVENKTIKFLRDDWLTPEVHSELLKKLAEQFTIFSGENDAMYATGAQFVWFHKDNDFCLFEENKCLLYAGAEAIEVFTERPFMLNRADLQAIHCFISSDWVERGVNLVDAQKNEFTLAEINEVMAQADPTYDGLDLLADASWVTELGSALSKALQLELQIDDDLK